MNGNTWALPYPSGGRLVRPAVRRVLARARALAAMVLRARIESMPAGPERFDRHEELVQRFEALGVMRRMEPRELLLLTAPPGRLSAQEHVDASWRAEGLAVLGWALELGPMPPGGELVDVEPLLAAVRDTGVRARLKSERELCLAAREMRREQLLVWRERKVHPEPRALDRRMSIALERRRAAEWLVGFGPDYCAVPVVWYPVSEVSSAMTETRKDRV